MASGNDFRCCQRNYAYIHPRGPAQACKSNCSLETSALWVGKRVMTELRSRKLGDHFSNRSLCLGDGYANQKENSNESGLTKKFFRISPSTKVGIFPMYNIFCPTKHSQIK